MSERKLELIKVLSKLSFIRKIFFFCFLFLGSQKKFRLKEKHIETAKQNKNEKQTKNLSPTLS